MNNNSITDIWNNLALAEEAGLTKRRIPVESPLYVYGTYRHPDNLYGIAFSYDSSLTIPVDQFKSLKELEILQMPDTSFEHRNLLLIQLHHTDCLGVFATLCSDLTSAITRESSEKSALRIVLNQLEKWRTLFDRGLAAGNGRILGRLRQGHERLSGGGLGHRGKDNRDQRFGSTYDKRGTPTG